MNDTIWAGVDIGGTKTAVVLSAEPPAILSRVEFPTLPANGPGPAIQQIVAALRESLQREKSNGRELQAIGVSCGGPLDRISGLIQAPPNLSTWIDVPITELLGREFGVPCRLENDANAGAVAEHRFGAGRGVQHMVFLTMGTGLGAGIVANGRLYHGANDMAGEIGHVRLTRTGPIGYHKAGSVEGWASGGGMAQLAARMVAAAEKSGRQTALTACLATTGAVTARDVAVAAQAGDALAVRILRTVGRKLGTALAILIDILNPERIVIGGIAMRLGEAILDPARKQLEREALGQSTSACQLVPAELHEKIGDIAALCVALGDL
jgi:glucokinase